MMSEREYNTCAQKKDQRHTYIRTHFIVMKLELFIVSGLRGIFSSLSYFGYHYIAAVVSANKKRTHGGENVVKLIILSLLFFFSFRVFDSCNLAYSMHTQAHMAVGIYYCCYSSFFWTIKFAEKNGALMLAILLR